MSVWGGLAVEVNGENVRNVTMADRVESHCFPAMAPIASSTRRVTVTLPAELVAGIDRYERNRSRFIAEAVRHELKRRRRQDLERSLEHPHPDSLATATLGLRSWAVSLPTNDVVGLAGQSISAQLHCSGGAFDQLSGRSVKSGGTLSRFQSVPTSAAALGCGAPPTEGSTGLKSGQTGVADTCHQQGHRLLYRFGDGGAVG